MLYLTILTISFFYIFRKPMIKVLTDTLMKDGKHSRKSWQMFISFVVSIVLGFIIVFRKDLNAYAIEVFFGFLAMAGGMAALTVWDKVRGNTNTTKDEK